MRARSPLLVPVVLAAALFAAVLPAGASGRASWPALGLGSRGIEVSALQHLLRSRGATVVADGVFRATTQAAVVEIQRENGLAVSGVADAATWERLVPELAAGSSGEAVVAVQELLNRKRGAGLALSGAYDAPTEAAVRAFQGHSGLEQSGILDPPTWRNLLWHYARPVFSLPGLCNYNGGNSGADWGSGAAIGSMEAAAGLFFTRTGSHAAIGDISWEHGGGITLHATHEVGLDVDVALVRTDRRQCNRPGIAYGSGQYDRDATRELIRAIYEAAPHNVKLIYFNDPVLVAEGLVERYPNHSDHLHVRFCEVGHPLERYRCAAPALGSDSLAPSTPAQPPAQPLVDPMGPVLLAVAGGAML